MEEAPDTILSKKESTSSTHLVTKLRGGIRQGRASMSAGNVTVFSRQTRAEALPRCGKSAKGPRVPEESFPRAAAFKAATMACLTSSVQQGSNRGRFGPSPTAAMPGRGAAKRNDAPALGSLARLEPPGLLIDGRNDRLRVCGGVAGAHAGVAARSANMGDLATREICDPDAMVLPP